jgi:hypothetical protein
LSIPTVDYVRLPFGTQLNAGYCHLHTAENILIAHKESLLGGGSVSEIVKSNRRFKSSLGSVHQIKSSAIKTRKNGRVGTWREESEDKSYSEKIIELA